MTERVLTAGDAVCRFDPDDGCRLTSLTVAGHELLLADAAPTPWPGGSFVMAPFAGRIRDGEVQWGQHRVAYPRNDDGHAQHGLVHAARWHQLDDRTWEVRVDKDAWLAACTVRQQLRLTPEALHLDLEVVADEPVPATVGWHPWFRREVGGADVRLAIDAQHVLAKDGVGITTDRRIPLPPQPWDDTFGAIRWPIRLTWPGVLELQIVSDAPVAVVYTARSDAICIEPQSGPPDEVNSPAPRLAAPGEPLRLSSTWRWITPAA